MVLNTGALVTGCLPRRQVSVFIFLVERSVKMIMQEESGM